MFPSRLLLVVTQQEKMTFLAAQRRYLSLTSVQYDPSDLLGKPLALVTLIPIFGIVSYLTNIVLSRDLTSILGLSGQLVNEILNALLKNYIQEPRPKSKVFLLKGFDAKG